jgi:SET domain-containing protein
MWPMDLLFLFILGKGLFADKEYSPGEFIVEYAGDLINRKEGLKREKYYPQEKGSYIYFFLFNSKKYW